MQKKKGKSKGKGKSSAMLVTLQPDAAGVDIGAEEMASQHITHMQKALSQMNVQIHHVLSEITGVSGLAMLDAILDGERNPVKLASLCNWRVRSSREVVAQALAGDYRFEHLFTLRQSLQGYRYYQKMIAEVDGELKKLLDQSPPAK